MASFAGRAFALMLLVLLSGLSTEARSQSYNEAFGLYIKSDFKGSEKMAYAALKVAKMPGDKVKLFKLLGIVQFMQNKKPLAQTNFKRALTINPSLEISEDEALDESVIPFFKQVAKSGGGGGKSSAADAPGPSSRGKSSAADAPGPSSRGGKAAKKGAPDDGGAPKPASNGKTPTYGKPINGTKIVIETNVKNAKVSVDGILAGDVNRSLEVDPGIREISITAKGYKTKNVKVKAAKNRESKFTVTLEKPQPPKPKVSPQQQQAEQQQALAANDPRNKGKKGGKKAKSKKGDMVLPGVDKGLFKDEQEGALPDDTGGRDVAAEFQYETGAAVQSSGPAPIQPQQPVVTQVPQQQYVQQPQQLAGQPAQPGQVMQQYPQQPMQGPTTVVVQAPPQQYYPPPQYAAPPPQYAAPAATTAAPLPPPTPPAPDYYGDPPDSVTGNDSADSAPSSGGSGSKSKPGTKGGKKPSLFIAILPLGAGQFQNGDTLLGVAFAGAQAAGFLMYYQGMQDSAKNEANFKKATDQNAATPKELSDDDYKNYQDQYNAFKASSASSQSTGMLLMLGAYGASVGQAIYAMPSADAPVKKKKKRRRYSLSPDHESIYVQDDSLKPGESVDFTSLLPNRGPEPYVLHMQLAPLTPSQETGLGYGVVFDYRF